MDDFEFIEAMSRLTGDLDDVLDCCSPHEPLSVESCLHQLEQVLREAQRLLKGHERRFMRRHSC